MVCIEKKNSILLDHFNMNENVNFINDMIIQFPKYLKRKHYENNI